MSIELEQVMNKNDVYKFIADNSNKIINKFDDSLFLTQ